MLEKLFIGFGSGIASHLRAWTFILRNGLFWYFVFPIIFNALVFFGGINLVGYASDMLISFLEQVLNTDNIELWGKEHLGNILYFLAWIVFRILFFIVFAYIGGYVVLLLMSPVFAILSDKTAEIVTGVNIPFNLLQFINDIFRGVAVTGRNLVLELLFMVFFFVLGFVPFIGLASPFALLGITAYYYGYSFIDYTLERKKMSMAEAAKFMRRNSTSTIAIGLPFAAVLIIPIVGPMIAGFVAINTTVSATLETLKILDQEKK